MNNFIDRLRKLDAYLYPEPGNNWSVISVDGDGAVPYFTGWGKTPEEALYEAERAHIKWKEKGDGK